MVTAVLPVMSQPAVLWTVIMCFKRHCISASAGVKGERNTVSLPPEPHAGLHARTIGERMLLSSRHQSSDAFDRISLYVMDTVLVLFPFGPTCIVNHCQVHKKAKTHEP